MTGSTQTALNLSDWLDLMNSPAGAAALQEFLLDNVSTDETVAKAGAATDEG